MANLTLDETTRSTRIDLPARPRLSLPAARDAVIVPGWRLAAVGRLQGAQYALATMSGPSHRLMQQGNRSAALIQQSINPSTTNGIAARLGSPKACGAVIDEGPKATKHDGTDSFVTSLGSRPPSPPPV